MLRLQSSCLRKEKRVRQNRAPLRRIQKPQKDCPRKLKWLATRDREAHNERKEGKALDQLAPAGQTRSFTEMDVVYRFAHDSLPHSATNRHSSADNPEGRPLSKSLAKGYSALHRSERLLQSSRMQYIVFPPAGCSRTHRASHLGRGIPDGCNYSPELLPLTLTCSRAVVSHCRNLASARAGMKRSGQTNTCD